MNTFLGSRGEGIFSLLITESYSTSRPIFVPEFLGSSWPVVDYIVRLRGATGSVAPYFFVQVKTTSRGYTESGRLKASISAREMRGLVANPVPTYIVGVDVKERAGYLLCANGGHQQGLSSLPSDFPLNRGTLEALWDEVNTFWKSVAPASFTSRFTDPARRDA
jgi:hypothetical protein